LTRFLRTRGFNFGAGCWKGAGGEGVQGDASLHGWLVLGGDGDLMVLGTGAGIEVIVDWVIAVGLGEGTRSILGAGLKRGYQPHLQHGSLIQQARQMSLPSC